MIVLAFSLRIHRKAGVTFAVEEAFIGLSEKVRDGNFRRRLLVTDVKLSLPETWRGTLAILIEVPAMFVNYPTASYA